MAIRVLQLICPTGYYGAERWVNALLSAQVEGEVEHHLAITVEPGISEEVLNHCPLQKDRQHRLAMTSKFDWRVIGRLVRLIRRERIHIVHTHGYKSDILGIIVARWAGVRSVCTPHGFENSTDRKLRAYLWLGGKTFRHFDWVCPLSPQIKQELMERYKVKANIIRLINNGVDLVEVERALQAPASTELTITRNSIDEPEQLFTIGYIGQLISRKNLEATLTAFHEFHEKHPASRLVLIGGGDQYQLLEQKSKALGLTKSVSFMGFRSDRLALLTQFDAFVLTSSLEGIPRCLMEAMAAEVCVTAFSIPGVDILLKDGKTGRLVPYGDTTALAQCWEELAGDSEARKHLAIAGKAFVYAHFSATAMAMSYMALYQDLMMEKGSDYG